MANEDIKKLAETPLELLSVPEHAQDKEWRRKYYEVVEVHNRYVPKAALEDGEP